MIKWVSTAATSLCLGVNGLLIWFSNRIPSDLPPQPLHWLEGFFHLFSEPMSAGTLTLLCGIIAVMSMCIQDILMGLFFAILAFILNALVLLGLLSTHYPPLAHVILSLVKP